MTTYMATAKGEKAKKPPGTSMGASNRSSTGYTHQDELAKTAQKQSKNLFYSHKKKLKIVAMFRSSSLRLFLVDVFFSSSRIQIPSGVLRPLPRGASRGSRTVHFFVFPPQRSYSICLWEGLGFKSLYKSETFDSEPIQEVTLSSTRDLVFLDDIFKTWF